MLQTVATMRALQTEVAKMQALRVHKSMDPDWDASGGNSGIDKTTGENDEARLSALQLQLQEFGSSASCLI